VVFVIFLFLRSPMATLIPSLALPMSLIGTFVVMRLLNYSLDNWFLTWSERSKAPMLLEDFKGLCVGVHYTKLRNAFNKVNKLYAR
jgi:hypothetical protein